MLSKGWTIVRSSLSRSDLSTITMFMGTVYLSYSAFYVSVNVPGLSLFIGVILNSLFVVLLVVVIKSSLEARQLLKSQQRAIYENSIDALKPAINLKLRIMS